MYTSYKTICASECQVYNSRNVGRFGHIAVEWKGFQCQCISMKNMRDFQFANGNMAICCLIREVSYESIHRTLCVCMC